MKKLLILFAKGFPYGAGEPFLESEYRLYRERFDKVLLVTSCKKGTKPTRTLDDPAIEVLPDHTQFRHLPSMVLGLGRMLTDGMFYRELAYLIRKGLFTPRQLVSVMLCALTANNQAAKAHKWLKKHPEFQQAVLYSYWMHIPAYASVRLKKRLGGRVRALSRAHGFDVYLQRHSGEYLPYHSQLYRELDQIAVISQNGKQALLTRYGEAGKVCVHRLGAMDRQKQNPVADRQVFRIVTCARTIPLKRLDRLVDALCLLTHRPICWTHIGTGQCQQELERYAAERLPENVTAEFMGFLPNTEIYNCYATKPFHIFINVSETEGVPVSIMEAMSFHIPVIATAVGGTPELIEEGKNGYLLPERFTDEALAERICQVMELGEEDYRSLRTHAREKFQQEYSAEPNYRKFIEYLSENSQNLK